MKKNGNRLDDFFRESLENLRVPPSGEAREKFLRDATSLTEKKSSHRIRRWSILLSLLLISGVTGYLLLNEISFTEEKNVIHSNLKIEKYDGKQTSSVTSDNLQQSFTSAPLTPEIPAAVVKAADASEQNNEETMQSSPVEDLKKTTEQPILSEPAIGLKDAEKIPDTVAGIIPAEKPVNPLNDVDPDNEKKVRGSMLNSEYSFSAGVSYSPEWLFNIEGENGKFCNNIGVGVTFRYQEYSIGTGLGLSFHNGSNQYSISTQKFLGTYSKLDSVIFDWDPAGYQYVAKVVTSPETVYDSAIVYNYEKINKKYTYIQIPLILGYDFYCTEKFCIGLRAGPILSVLLSAKEDDLYYDPGKDKLVMINQITPERIQTNWQIMGGFNFLWKPSRRIGIEAGPQAKYYFNSVYEKKDANQKPWSVGVSAGIIYIF